MLEANLVGVLGRKKTGKSTLLRVIVRYQWERYRDVRFVVWDRTKEWLERPRVRVVPADRGTAEDAAQLAIELAPCTLVVPEVDLPCPNHGGGLVPGTALHAICHYGRHLEGKGAQAGRVGVALMYDARRSSRVHTDLRALADVLYFFRHTEPRDLQGIAELCGQDWADRVSRLPPREYLRFDAAG